MKRLKKQVASMRNEALRNAVYAIKEFVRAQPRPILIYQMAKVGSTSVYKALREEGMYPLHVHHVADEHRKSGFEYYGRHGVAPPIHLYVSRMLYRYLGWTSHRLKVISLVRDPIARYVSGLYQMAGFSDTVSGDVAGTRKNIIAELSKPGALDYTFGWFDREIKPMLDVDVMVESFNSEQGHGLYSGPRADVLVVKLERLPDLLPGVVSSFMGTSLKNVRANVGHRKRKGREYQRVKEKLRLPASVCDRIYSHAWVRHFYTDEEVKDFKAKWT